MSIEIITKQLIKTQTISYYLERTETQGIIIAENKKSPYITIGIIIGS